MPKKLAFLIVLVFVLLFCPIISVEATSTMWSHTYGGVNDKSSGSSLVATSDGGYAVLGEINGDIWLMKTDDFGNMVWNKTYGGTTFDSACSLVTTSDGGYVIAGTAQFLGTGQYDFWLIKTDAFGNVEWNKTYGGTHPDTAYSMVATSDGGYAIAGSITSEDVIQHDCWLVKTDQYGNMEWNKTYGKSGVFDVDIAYHLVEASDGGFALIGHSYTCGFDERNSWGYVNITYWLAKVDYVGNMLWNKTYGESGDDILHSLIVTSDGGYALASGSRLVKTDEHGNMEWDQTYSEGSIHSLVETSDGGFAIAGYTYLPDDPNVVYVFANIWLVKTDAYGNMMWNSSIGMLGDAEEPSSLIEASDGGYVIVGTTSHWKKEVRKLLLVKTDEIGYLPEYYSAIIVSILSAANLFILINQKKLFNSHS